MTKARRRYGQFVVPKQRQRGTQFARAPWDHFSIETLGEKQWPTLSITADCHGKMMALVQECDIEVGWLSSCTRSGDSFVIDDVFVPEQVCSAASTRITRDGEAELLSELMSTGKADVIRNLHCWGHSHVTMEVFASGTDNVATTEFLRKRKNHFIRVIANQYGDLFASVYLLQEGFVYHNLPMMLEPPLTDKWRLWARMEIERKVTPEILDFENGIVSELELEVLDERLLKDWRKRGVIDSRLYAHLTTTTAHNRKHATKGTIS